VLAASSEATGGAPQNRQRFIISRRAKDHLEIAGIILVEKGLKVCFEARIDPTTRQDRGYPRRDVRTHGLVSFPILTRHVKAIRRSGFAGRSCATFLAQAPGRSGHPMQGGGHLGFSHVEPRQRTYRTSRMLIAS
jgi:hypothetical protein